MSFIRVAVLMLAVPSVALAGNPVPEIDPSSAGAAITLLSGCVLVFRARRKK
jgi:hypothetical protein